MLLVLGTACAGVAINLAILGVLIWRDAVRTVQRWQRRSHGIGH